MAHTKSTGTTRLGRDSRAKRLGVKKFDGQSVHVGQIIIRQHGTKWWPGEGVRLGSDYTIYAARDGVVRFTTHTRTRFDGNRRIIRTVHVIPKI